MPLNKHLLLFAALSALAFHPQAQTCSYHCFPDSGVVWRELDNSINGNYLREFNFEQFINGDTLIQETTYHKVYKTGTYKEISLNDGQIHSFSTFSNQYVAAIRQDKNAKQVFIYTPFEDEEQVLYNFNLSVGDTLPLSYIHRWADDTIWVSKIDSIFDGTGYRKRYILNDVIGYIGDNPALIEGIGSTFGLFYPIDHPFENSGHLLCFKNNNTIDYTNGSSNACDLPTGIKDKESCFKVMLYPNPVEKELRITNVDIQIVEIGIYNVLGEKLYSKSEITNHKSEILIDIPFLPAGIYFVQVISENGRWAGKFVKQ